MCLAQAVRRRILTRFNAMGIHDDFQMSKVTLGQELLQVLRFSLLMIVYRTNIYCTNVPYISVIVCDVCDRRDKPARYQNFRRYLEMCF
jgi:hypothetical protein